MLRTVVLLTLLLSSTGCGRVGRALFIAGVVTATVVQTTVRVCAQEDVDCSGDAPSTEPIEIRDTTDPYASAVDW